MNVRNRKTSLNKKTGCMIGKLCEVMKITCKMTGERNGRFLIQETGSVKPMQSFLIMSFSGGILILLIHILRILAGRHLPRRLFVLLWMVAVLRLLLPVFLPVPVGFIPDLKTFFSSGEPPERIPDRSGDSFTDVRGMNLSMSEISVLQEPLEGTSRQDSHPYRIWIPAGVWLLGMFGTALVFWMKGRQERSILKQSLPLGVRERSRLFCRAEAFAGEAIRMEYFGFDQRGRAKVCFCCSDRICTPVAAGILRPTLILPDTVLSDYAFPVGYVLLHEMVHIRRRDNLVKLLALAAVCVHWFHPAVWLLLHDLTQDIELSCDQKVLSMTGGRRRREYADALLRLAAQNSSAGILTSGFGERELRERLVNIMKYKKVSKITGMTAGLILALSLGVFAQASQIQPEKTEESAEVQAEESREIPGETRGAADSEDASEGTEEEIVEQVGMNVEYALENEEDWQMLDIIDFSVDGATLSFTAELHDANGKRPWAAKDHVYVNDQDCLLQVFSEDPQYPAQYHCIVDLTANEEADLSPSDQFHVKMNLYVSQEDPTDTEPLDFTVHLYDDGQVWKEVYSDQTIELPEGGIVEVKDLFLAPTKQSFKLQFLISGEHADEALQAYQMLLYVTEDDQGNQHSSLVAQEGEIRELENGGYALEQKLTYTDIDLSAQTLRLIPCTREADASGKLDPSTQVEHEELAFTINLG